jgi:hypothetical protein
MKSSSHQLLAPIALVALVLTLTLAFTSSSPSGTTGAPGQNDCTQCHGSFALNSGPASFTISAPASISPGATVPVLVAFSGSSVNKWGFALTARDAGGNAAGSFQIVDSTNTQLIGGTSGQEAGHTSSGSGHSFWVVNWVAPASLSGTSVTFYASGLEGNGGGTSGDYVYTASTTSAVLGLALQVTSTGTNLAISVTGSAAQAGHEYWTLPTLNATPGPFFGISPDVFTFAILEAGPILLPGIHSFLGASGSDSFTYPAGTLATLAGIPMTWVCLSASPAGSLSGVSNVVTIVP